MTKPKIFKSQSQHIRIHPTRERKTLNIEQRAQSQIHINTVPNLNRDCNKHYKKSWILAKITNDLKSVVISGCNFYIGGGQDRHKRVWKNHFFSGLFRWFFFFFKIRRFFNFLLLVMVVSIVDFFFVKSIIGILNVSIIGICCC